MRKIILSLFLFPAIHSIAQDTLPDFSVNNKGNNRIVVSWNNKFQQVKQISIQRSPDSLNNFKTILTVPDPMNRQNGYMDTKAANDQMFYRLYILFNGANFLFTKPQKPVSDSLLQQLFNKSLTNTKLTQEELRLLQKYKYRFDVIKDTSTKEINGGLKDKNKVEVLTTTYRISPNRDGNVRIRLKDFDRKKYSVKFFEDDDTFLFELKEINEATLILDKSNFYHAGWFKFELYDDGKLVEKNRFQIQKDF